MSSLVQTLDSHFQIEVPPSFESGVQSLQTDEFRAILVSGPQEALLKTFLEVDGLLDQLPDGLALLDSDLKILWANDRLLQLTAFTESLDGQNFYQVFGTPEILGPDYSPFNTALGQGVCARSQLRIGEKTYFEVQSLPRPPLHRECSAVTFSSSCAMSRVMLHNRNSMPSIRRASTWVTFHPRKSWRCRLMTGSSC
ncbi:MAG: PAS domain-containing protein [Planctomycetaceae bacterium]